MADDFIRHDASPTYRRRDGWKHVFTRNHGRRSGLVARDIIRTMLQRFGVSDRLHPVSRCFPL